MNNIGIDLGDSYSRITFLDGENIKTIETPLAFGIDENSNEIFGEIPEKNYLEGDIENNIINICRLLGSRQKISFKKSSKEFYPEEIIAKIIKNLFSLALINDSDLAQKNITITIPSSATILYCEALYRACQLVRGIKHVNFLPESIANAIYYSFNKTKNENILIYNFDEEKFDSSLVKVENNTYKQLSSNGSIFLGGMDLDDLIAEKIFLKRLEEKYKTLDLNPQNQEFKDMFLKLKNISKNVRKKLTTSSQADFNVSLKINGGGLNENYTISQDELEKIFTPVIEKTIEESKLTIEESKIGSKRLIDKVLFKGRITKFSFVKKKLFLDLNLNFEYLDFNSASIGAYYFSKKQENNIIVKDLAIPHSIGIGLVERDRKSGKNYNKYEVIFEKNSILPLEKTFPLTIAQESNKTSETNALPVFAVLEGESRTPLYNFFVCKLLLSGKDFEYDLFKGYEVEITVKVDLLRNLSVEARIPIINKSGNIRKSLRDNSINLKKVFENLNIAASEIKKIEHFLSDAEKTDIYSKIEEVKNMVNNAAIDSIEERTANAHVLKLLNTVDNLKFVEARPVEAKIDELEKSINNVLTKNLSFSISRVKDSLDNFIAKNTLNMDTRDEILDTIAIRLQGLANILNNEKKKFKESQILINLACETAKSYQIRNICFRDLSVINDNIKNYNAIKYFLESDFVKALFKKSKKFIFLIIFIIIAIVVIKALMA